jgi:hypothetical protein
VQRYSGRQEAYEELEQQGGVSAAGEVLGNMSKKMKSKKVVGK